MNTRLTPSSKNFRIFLGAIAFATIVGCGGSGASSNAVVSPFTGRWVGTFITPSVNQSGTGMITIASDGTFSGTGHNTNTGVDSTVMGTIDNGGNISGTTTGTNSATLSGQLGIIGSNGHLTGSITSTNANGSLVNNYDLVKQ